ncbi:MAG: acetoin utilization protein AcuC, partial [Pseudomonadota bacterium]
SEMALIRDELILPLVDAFGPEAVVLQCGADAVEEDPLSNLALSNNAHWAIVSALKGLAPRYLVLGGGGYNPWSVGRLWTGVWATLNGHDIPEQLPREAEEVLRQLQWHDQPRSKATQPHWFTTLRDVPRDGPIRPELRADIQTIRAQSP